MGVIGFAVGTGELAMVRCFVLGFPFVCDVGFDLELYEEGVEEFIETLF